jgi:hypothetical protein
MAMDNGSEDARTRDPVDARITELIAQHQFWRARVREAVERARRVKTTGGAVREYCRRLRHKLRPPGSSSGN